MFLLTPLFCASNAMTNSQIDPVSNPASFLNQINSYEDVFKFRNFMIPKNIFPDFQFKEYIRGNKKLNGLLAGGKVSFQIDLNQQTYVLMGNGMKLVGQFSGNTTILYQNTKTFYDSQSKDVVFFADKIKYTLQQGGLLLVQELGSDNNWNFVAQKQLLVSQPQSTSNLASQTIPQSSIPQSSRPTPLMQSSPQSTAAKQVDSSQWDSSVTSPQQRLSSTQENSMLPVAQALTTPPLQESSLSLSSSDWDLNASKKSYSDAASSYMNSTSNKNLEITSYSSTQAPSPEKPLEFLEKFSSYGEILNAKYNSGTSSTDFVLKKFPLFKPEKYKGLSTGALGDGTIFHILSPNVFTLSRAGILYKQETNGDVVISSKNNTTVYNANGDIYVFIKNYRYFIRKDGLVQIDSQDQFTRNWALLGQKNLSLVEPTYAVSGQEVQKETYISTDTTASRNSAALPFLIILPLLAAVYTAFKVFTLVELAREKKDDAQNEKDIGLQQNHNRIRSSRISISQKGKLITTVAFLLSSLILFILAFVYCLIKWSEISEARMYSLGTEMCGIFLLCTLLEMYFVDSGPNVTTIIAFASLVSIYFILCSGISTDSEEVWRSGMTYMFSIFFMLGVLNLLFEGHHVFARSEMDKAESLLLDYPKFSEESSLSNSKSSVKELSPALLILPFVTVATILTCSIIFWAQQDTLSYSNSLIVCTVMTTVCLLLEINRLFVVPLPTDLAILLLCVSFLSFCVAKIFLTTSWRVGFMTLFVIFFVMMALSEVYKLLIIKNVGLDSASSITLLSFTSIMALAVIINSIVYWSWKTISHGQALALGIVMAIVCLICEISSMITYWVSVRKNMTGSYSPVLGNLFTTGGIINCIISFMSIALLASYNNDKELGQIASSNY